MMVGEYNHNLDDKFRLAIPIKFRRELEEGAVITKGLDNCLFLYTKNEWNKLAEKLATLPFSQANSRAFARHMLSGAFEAEIDKQGRVVIPEYLRNFAGLKKSLIIAGLYNRAEIWDADAWNAYKVKTERESNEIAEKLNDLGV
ncbi:MAG TPA: division/cell wall cluster transcriptional repressor MraZ [Candidatus Magasanikbacteria bacterium]|nr:division/cell wall cluster transcriptional repressor MraZ [Candidatus Magasanikbacteria bacterium]